MQAPVYLLLGRFDYMAPSELAERYLNELKAPRKAPYWFEQSGHAPMILIATILKENLG